jgi:hypothetical protein
MGYWMGWVKRWRDIGVYIVGEVYTWLSETLVSRFWVVGMELTSTLPPVVTANDPLALHSNSALTPLAEPHPSNSYNPTP